MFTAPTMSTRACPMTSDPAPPGSRETRSARRIRVPRARPPTASLLEPPLHTVEQTRQPEFELLRGGSRRQLLGQRDQMRVLLGWQRAVKVAQRQALRCPKASGAEIVHRLLQNRSQHLMGHRRVDVSRQSLIEAALKQNPEGQLPASQRIWTDRHRGSEQGGHVWM